MTPWEKKHADMVASVIKPGEEILNGITAEDLSVLHDAIGVCGEVAELMEAFMVPDLSLCNLENIVEELGDIEFHLCDLRKHLGVARQEPLNIDMFVMEPRAAGESLAVQAGRLLDAIKKIIIYRKPVCPDTEEVIRRAMQGIETGLALVRKYFDIGREATLIYNYHKLERRYPGFKYSDDAAQKRADKS